MIFHVRGGKDISRKSSSTITIFGFLDFEVPGSTCTVSGKEEGGTFQENHSLQLQFLASLILRFPEFKITVF